MHWRMNHNIHGEADESRSAEESVLGGRAECAPWGQPPPVQRRHIRPNGRTEPPRMASFLPLAFSLLLWWAMALPGRAEWVYLDNGQVRLGVNLNAGACVGWFSPSGSTKNLLNSSDEGRYLQQSYYGDKDGSLWNKEPWRYNPVQGGSWKREPSVVVESKATAASFYAKTRPRHWATGALLDDMIYEEWLHLEGGLARLRFKMTYTGQTIHRPTHQELPALFVQPEYDTLIFCEKGSPPWTDQPLARKQPGFPNERVEFSEPWAAWVSAGGQGLGIYVPHATEATCYRWRDGGKTDCSYIAPLGTFALKPGLTFTYDAVLALGTAEQIRSIFRKLHAERGVAGKQ